MLLRVGLAHVRARKRGHPDEGLGDRLNLENIEGESRPLVEETCSHRAIGIIQINGDSAEAAHRLAFSKRAVCHCLF